MVGGKSVFWKPLSETTFELDQVSFFFITPSFMGPQAKKLQAKGLHFQILPL